MAGGLDSNVKLLVHADGSEGSYAVIDSGYRSAMGGTQPGGHLGTLVGTAAISAAQSKFGGASLVLDGNSDYVMVPDSADWDFGTAPFTIDTWIYLTTDQQGVIVAQEQDAQNGWILQYGSGSGGYIAFSAYVSNTAIADYYTTPPLNLGTDTWVHVALVRNGTSIYIFVDGVSKTLTTATAIGSSAMLSLTGVLKVGYEQYVVPAYFSGYIDELRISKGIARWTSGFSVPTAPYTADGKTNLLLHFDAADTPYTGQTAKVGTFVGTAQHAPNSIMPAMIGNGSLCLDGNSDYLTLADSADWSFGDADFTIDCWVRLGAVDALQTIVSQYEDADNYWHFDITAANKLQIIFEDDNTVKGSYIMTSAIAGLATGIWYHIAVMRASDVCYMYVNGVSQVVTETTAFDDVGLIAGLLEIGDYDTGNNYLNGYIDELRICKGTAAFATAGFIPSIVPYTNTTAANTVLLCHFDNYQIDSSASPHALTQVGTAYNTGDYVVGATSPAVGAGAWRFDGTDDYISYPDAADFSFGTGNFTVDFWFKPTTIGSLQCIASQYEDADNYWHMDITAANKLQMIFEDGNTVVGSYIMTSAISGYAINTWYHFALVRNGAGAILFVNGVSQATTETTAFADVGLIAGVLQVGAYNAGNFIAGYVDNLRVLKGTAAWTTDFTPPTTPYTGSDIPTSGNGLYAQLDYSGVDSGGSAHVPTYVSNTYGATALSRFTGSILLDGNSDEVTFVDNDDWTFADGNFTIDGWVKFVGIGAQQTIVGQYEGANDYWFLQITAANKLQLKFREASTTAGDYIMASAITGLTVNVWYHIAVVRNSATCLMFINGVSQSVTETTAFATIGNVAAVLDVGQQNAGTWLSGYLDELRVSKGIARWTAAFTPPTTPYSRGGPSGVLKVIGVLLTGIKKFIGIDTGDIKKIIGVE